MAKFIQILKDINELIVFKHSVFALPFIFVAMIVASKNANEIPVIKRTNPIELIKTIGKAILLTKSKASVKGFANISITIIWRISAIKVIEYNSNSLYLDFFTSL